MSWTLAIYIAIGVGVYCLYAWSIHNLKGKLEYRKRRMTGDLEQEECLSAKDYVGEEHEWKPTFNLEHRGVKVFNIPFEPDEHEVFYLENEYDEDANRYVRENIADITEKLATKGLRFVYLPYMNVPQELILSSIAYRNPQGKPVEPVSVQSAKDLPSNFLLDYMIHPENRNRIRTGFAWYGRHWQLSNKKIIYQFDYIAFDGKEALANPEAVLAEILPELGCTRVFKQGYYSIQAPPNDGSADQYFTEEMKKILEDIQSQLDTIRLKGVSEAVIARYIQPRPELSHIRITQDFRIFLDDYDGLEIKMEPLIKAVYILFLRHDGGIAFKDLSDYQVELELIYRAIKNKRNDVDARLEQKLLPPVISENVRKLTDPFDNSINEKCTRIKESFVKHFHESIARYYYVDGGRMCNKEVILPRELIIWEGSE